MTNGSNRNVGSSDDPNAGLLDDKVGNLKYFLKANFFWHFYLEKQSFNVVQFPDIKDVTYIINIEDVFSFFESYLNIY